MELGILIIIGTFIIYYFAVIFSEKKIISEPKDIIDKFLSILLLYAGISIIYYAFTGSPFLTDSEESYSVYIFIIGFVAILWTVPNLLSEFRFFKDFVKKGEKLEKERKKNSRRKIK